MRKSNWTFQLFCLALALKVQPIAKAETGFGKKPQEPVVDEGRGMAKPKGKINAEKVGKVRMPHDGKYPLLTEAQISALCNGEALEEELQPGSNFSQNKGKVSLDRILPKGFDQRYSGKFKETLDEWETQNVHSNGDKVLVDGKEIKVTRDNHKDWYGIVDKGDEGKKKELLEHDFTQDIRDRITWLENDKNKLDNDFVGTRKQNQLYMLNDFLARSAGGKITGSQLMGDAKIAGLMAKSGYRVGGGMYKDGKWVGGTGYETRREVALDLIRTKSESSQSTIGKVDRAVGGSASSSGGVGTAECDSASARSAAGSGFASSSDKSVVVGSAQSDPVSKNSGDGNGGMAN